MKYFKIAKNLSIFLLSISLYSQSYTGLATDNFSGIHGLLSNPANVVDSRMRTDVNIASASAFLGSDYFGLSLKDIFRDDIDFDQVTRFPKDKNNFFTTIDIMGPSFMFNLNKTNSIGLITRVRGINNINNLNGNLFESIEEGFDEDQDYTFNSEDLTSTAHIWAEVGITYGRVLYNEADHFLKAGITLKLLQGGGANFINSPGLSGSYDASAQTLATTGSLNYGASEAFDSNDSSDFNNLSTGFGADIGFIYEWRKGNTSSAQADNKYLLKLGLSITDIGSINYKNSTFSNYDLNNTVSSTTNFNDTDDFLDDNYSFTETRTTAKIKLPTAINLSADYHLNNKIYVSLLSSFSLIKSNTELSNKINNSVTIAPRLETKWFSFYSPISFRQYDDFAWGAGIRFGPLTVGSGSILTNLISDTSKTADVFFGLKVPIYQKK
ncbi:DUF5723 family protein [Lacinutrix sp.]|uniref:DUF5723 family protein n=1 Tax=Lacinutrix sp. TaxID=1937692 RepID=UPI0025C37467|nr:DUF5723 family protein [Lacinutrix sp.]